MEGRNAYNAYEELQAALALCPHEERAKEALNTAYRRYLDHHTREVPIALVGPFAQTDYLLKEHHADKALRRLVHDVRKYLGGQREGAGYSPLFLFSVLAHFFAQVEGEEMPSYVRTHVLSLTEMARTYREQFDTPEAGRPTEGEAAVNGDKAAATAAKVRRYEALRFLLSHWDDTFLYGSIETVEQEEAGAGPEETCKVRYAPTFAYLRPMLSPHMQFNLVQARYKEGVWTADLLILEPDYLVNVTSVARCFESYDESPYVYLLQKLAPSTTTFHTLLGNFAGQLLDEELHGATSYAESATHFFQHHASSLLTLDEMGDFHAQAARQREHIHRAMAEDLPKAVGGFHREEVLLEPSFYSEMLGLQGRMDLLQRDMKVLIEQKSGKGAFVAGEPQTDTPRPVESHYVQMLLYMLLVRYNYPEAYHAGSEGIQAFLLYSKYPNSLVKLDFAPDLVQRALRIRNGIAWMEMQLGGHLSEWNWQRLLLPLSPDTLNTKGCGGRLWTDYKRPELARLLAPIHQASPLERQYYFRLLDFVSREHLLAKVGSKERLHAGFAATWHDSLDEKRQAGNLYDRLHLASVSPLCFTFEPSANYDMANFRVGDIVVLYPYPKGAVPDVRRSLVHRASIEEIGDERIVLHLRAEQTDAEVFLCHKDEEWAIEHDFMEASYGSLYRGIHAFLSAPQERRDLLLLQRTPQVDETRMLLGEYGDFNDLMQRVKQAQDFFLIIGPPGTGKTSFGMLNTLKEELLEADSHVLLVSYTNRAVDEICGKLEEEGIDYLRLGSELACAPAYHARLFGTRVTGCRGLEEVREVFQQARVICATTTSATSHLELLQRKCFSLCIIDEASQILEPHLLGLLGATTQEGDGPLIRKFVMIGDHKQLPAVVQQGAEDAAIRVSSETEEDEAHLLEEIGLTNCRLSLFERLLKRYRQRPDLVYMLTRQGRMHHDIAAFPNELFYSSQLCEVPLPHQVGEVQIPVHWLHVSKSYMREETPSMDWERVLKQRVAFLNVPCPSDSISDKVNQPEAERIAEAARYIYAREGEQFDANRTLGIIVPYRNQIATIRNLLLRLAPEAPALSRITIDTVERFQGSQRRYILYGFTVQQVYQLDFLTDNTFEEEGQWIDRKLNVAMTRAMEHLILVGNQKLLERVPTFKELIHRYLIE